MDGLLNKKFLEDIGVTLDDQTYAALSQHYEETLNDRVISEIVDELDERQLEELNNLKGGSTDILQQWLQENVPQLDEIIEDEIAILLGEIAENSDIL
jgi:hypothetical protein